jgi:hypothetical protein
VSCQAKKSLTVFLFLVNFRTQTDIFKRTNKDGCEEEGLKAPAAPQP